LRIIPSPKGWSPLQRRSQLPVFVLGERAARLRPYVALRRRRHRELYDHFVIWCFGNCHGVILAGGEVKRFQLGTGRAKTLLCRIEPPRSVLDRFNALLREADKRDLGGHGVSSCTWRFGSPRLTIAEVGDCRFLWYGWYYFRMWGATAKRRDDMSPLRLAIPPRCLAAGVVSIVDVVKHRLEDLGLETNVLRDAYNAAR